MADQNPALSPELVPIHAVVTALETLHEDDGDGFCNECGCPASECPYIPMIGLLVTAAAEHDKYRDRFHAASDAAAEVLLPTVRPNGYITRPELWALDEACKPLRAAFPSFGPYLVGSVLERPTFRDVDVRLILKDKKYDRLSEAQWGLFGFVTSRHLASLTGLPIDFQVQRQTEASAAYGHKFRNPLGLRESGRQWVGDQRPEPLTRPAGGEG